MLLYSDSQHYYITQSFRIRTERIILNNIGQSDSVMIYLDIVQIRVKNKFTVYLEVLCVPFICSPLTRQTINLTTQMFPKLKVLTLAYLDYGSPNFLVGILLGLYYYHSCFTGKKIIKTTGRPTAMEFNFGLVLSDFIHPNVRRSVILLIWVLCVKLFMLCVALLKRYYT